MEPIISTKALLALLIEPPREPVSSEFQQSRLEYLKLASVLHVFDLAELRLSDSTEKGAAAAWIIDDTVTALGWAKTGKRTLRLEARQEGLQVLGDRLSMKAALDRTANREETDLQLLFEEWLGSGELKVEKLSARQLAAAQILCDWGLTTQEGFPSRATIDAAARIRSLTADFEALADRFVGRHAELARLQEFVGLSPTQPTNWLGLFSRKQTTSAMVLSGVGGTGKTALVARFVLDFFDGARGSDFPFVYLAFDDRSLKPTEPVTIIAAVLRKIDTQIDLWLTSKSPSRSERAGNLDRAIAKRDALRDMLTAFSSQRHRLGASAAAFDSQALRLGTLRSLDEQLFHAFAAMMDAVSRVGVGDASKPIPLLMILDSFEEVEYLPESDLELFWRMIDVLTDAVPNLRLLIVGRVPPISAALAKRKPFQFELGDLSEVDSLGLLGALGVDRRTARAVVEQIGRNPLTLHLAARAILSGTVEEGLAGVVTRHFGLFSVGQEIIRGQLYQRILGHIHDPDVRRLAHPGMVLRRVTPEIIAAVLAPICGLGPISTSRAVELFEGLGRELTLVRLDGSGALVYREELRRPMLKVMIADRPEEAQALHRAARDYYAGSEDAVGQAEFIYHELMLPDTDFDAIDQVWKRSLAPRLADAIDELPVENQGWLASKARIRISQEASRHVSVEEDEQILWREAVRAFRLGEFERVNDLLAGQRPTPESPLTVLRARALFALRKLSEAAVILENAVVDYPAYGEKAPIAEILWLHAQVQLALGNLDSARAALTQLLPIARGFSSALPAVQTLSELVPIADATVLERYRLELAEAMAALRDVDFYSQPSLVRLALVRLGPVQADLWARLLPNVIDGMAEGIAERPSEAREALRGKLSGFVEADDASVRLRTLASLLESELSYRQVVEIIGLLLRGLEEAPTDVLVLQAMWEVLRAEGTSFAASTLAGLESKGNVGAERPDDLGFEGIAMA
ncbi:MAG: ATP-binding protein [Bradyrhizobium sp.]|nr:ATP-binding protein [Bradyrhizobium sp.]